MSGVACVINGQNVVFASAPHNRLADALRDELGLTGTKIGCNAGDCGACTVLIDDRQVCACLVSVGRAAERTITTVEGLAETAIGRRLQQAFHHSGAAQCGICTPGMLMAATDLLMRCPIPDEQQVEAALGGVLCRCTGYRKIIEAVRNAAVQQCPAKQIDGSFGVSIPRLDGWAKALGTDRFGADGIPDDALRLRLIRSPHAHARVKIGDLESIVQNFDGLERVLSAKDIPGFNGFGVYPDLKDQPVLAEDVVRHRGEPVLALVGDARAIAEFDEAHLPISYEPLPSLHDIEKAVGVDAPLVHEQRGDNVLATGRVVMGDVDKALGDAAVVASAQLETSFVEHAYIEPEAGFARRVGSRIEVTACTQAPYMDRNEIAAVLGIALEDVRVIPSACGGGFGGKLDVSIQPILAVAAWLLNRPVACVYNRPESMASSTKRHPARISARAGADGEGRLTGFRFHGDFNTGAYASWGPTVASRVPVHATGPYVVRASHCTSRAIYTNDTPAGAFRGFGVPQTAIAHEAIMDDLAGQLGMDRLDFRSLNAIRPGDTTHFGQRLDTSVGMVECLERLRPIWQRERQRCLQQRADIEAATKHGVGIACMWYGLGNTSMSNPAEMEVALTNRGQLVLYNGAVDIGQGSATIMVQICAEALGLPISKFDQILGDTDLTKDAGKTSASRQTLVSGNAARLAGVDLREQILRLANAGVDAALDLEGSCLRVADGQHVVELDLTRLERLQGDEVLRGSGYWDPPAGPLDDNGQGTPYASYGFGAQLASVEVDPALGTVKVKKIWAAHDVGRAVNPMLVEGQIEGGIAQGIGMALMEEFVPGVNENLHDYLIPTVGDVPPIEILLVDGIETLGPFGAKGVGEPALVPTAPAIFNAIKDAVGVRPTKVPFTPSRLRQALLDRG